MANLFRSVRKTRLKRNPFNLSHDVKLTTDFGRLTPVLCKEVVPGDTWRIRSEMMIRTAPLYAPLMHRVNAYVHYFFVPCRLLMDDWETFITGGENGDGTVQKRFAPTSNYIHKPFITFKKLMDWYRELQSRLNVVGQGSLFDYLGYPALLSSDLRQLGSRGAVSQSIDLLPFKAYQLIYNEYYRDQNFEDEVDICSDVNGDFADYLGGSAGTSSQRNALMDGLFTLHQRNWEKDYFTSALPFPQRGADTTIGEGGELNVRSEADPEGYLSALQNGKVSLEDVLAHMDLKVDVPVTSINELRRALAIQKFREKLARYGSRYTEFLRGVFGVHPKDSRMQRPEFLGGFKQQIAFGEVLQTSQSTDDSPQGTYAGTGFSLSGGKYIKRYFDEHGYVLGILSIMPKPAYMQGWSREFTRFDKLDYYIPEFAHLGEQDIRKRELVFDPFDGTASAPNQNRELFGYIPRYAEYKFSPSRVCGMMRTNLDYWHLARRVVAGQNLNRVFLEVNQKEMDRVFNYVGSSEDSTPQPIAANDHFWLQVLHDIKAVRPMPKFGTPLI